MEHEFVWGNPHNWDFQYETVIGGIHFILYRSRTYTRTCKYVFCAEFLHTQFNPRWTTLAHFDVANDNNADNNAITQAEHFIKENVLGGIV